VRDAQEDGTQCYRDLEIRLRSPDPPHPILPADRHGTKRFFRVLSLSRARAESPAQQRLERSML